jgi:hypothetical protein
LFLKFFFKKQRYCQLDEKYLSMILKWVHEKLNASKVNFWIFNFFEKTLKMPTTS